MKKRSRLHGRRVAVVAPKGPDLDELRRRAHASGRYAGADSPEFVRRDPVSPIVGGKVGAKFSLYKFVNGSRCGFTATVYQDEQLALASESERAVAAMAPLAWLAEKAEAAALRMAFPPVSQRDHPEDTPSNPVPVDDRGTDAGDGDDDDE